MNPSSNLSPRIEAISWFHQAGHTSRPHFRFPVKFVESEELAFRLMTSDHWLDVKTEAQGDLTEYLFKNHRSDYNAYWNSLIIQSRASVEKTIQQKLLAVLNERAFPVECAQIVLLDIIRASVEVSYRKLSPKVPAFFESLLQVYEAGRLPCGWNGSLNEWPNGELFVF